MFKLYITLIRRELWENRGMVGVPLAVMFMQFIIGFVKSNQMKQLLSESINTASQTSVETLNQAGINIADTVNVPPIADLINQYAETSWHQLLLGTNISIFSVMLGIITVMFYFYCIYSLNREYQDRSFLFWKSLPISDAGIIFSKVLTIFTTVLGLAVLISVTLLLQVSVEIVMLIPEGLRLQFSRPTHSVTQNFCVKLNIEFIFIHGGTALLCLGLVSICLDALKSFYTCHCLSTNWGIYNQHYFRQRLNAQFFNLFKAIAAPFSAGLFENNDVFGSVIANFMQLFLQPNLGIGLAVGLLFIGLTIVVRMRKDV